MNASFLAPCSRRSPGRQKRNIPSACLPACLPVYLSLSRTFVCLSVCLSVWLAVYLVGWLVGWLVVQATRSKLQDSKAEDHPKSAVYNTEATQGSLRHRKACEQNHTKIPSHRLSRTTGAAFPLFAKKICFNFMTQGEGYPAQRNRKMTMRIVVSKQRGQSSRPKWKIGRPVKRRSSGSLSRRHSLWEHHGLCNLQGHT